MKSGQATVLLTSFCTTRPPACRPRWQAALVNCPGLAGLKAFHALKAAPGHASLAASSVVALYAGPARLTAEEAAVADRHHLSQVTYLGKRETYCR